MDNKDVVIVGLSLAILYLLKKQQQPVLQTVELRDNATLQNDENDANYHATIYSQNPIKATLLNKQKVNGKYNVRIESAVYDDWLKELPKVNGVPNLC